MDFFHLFSSIKSRWYLLVPTSSPHFRLDSRRKKSSKNTRRTGSTPSTNSYCHLPEKARPFYLIKEVFVAYKVVIFFKSSIKNEWWNWLLARKFTLLTGAATASDWLLALSTRPYPSLIWTTTDSTRCPISSNFYIQLFRAKVLFRIKVLFVLICAYN